MEEYTDANIRRWWADLESEDETAKAMAHYYLGTRWKDAIGALLGERAAIVAWLRAYKRDDTNWPQFLATAIEAGQHLGDSPTSPDDV